jgi:hypothetical protein
MSASPNSDTVTTTTSDNLVMGIIDNRGSTTVTPETGFTLKARYASEAGLRPCRSAPNTNRQITPTHSQLAHCKLDGYKKHSNSLTKFKSARLSTGVQVITVFLGDKVLVGTQLT